MKGMDRLGGEGLQQEAMDETAWHPELVEQIKQRTKRSQALKQLVLSELTMAGHSVTVF